jgi:hypothetical protein
MTEVFTIPMYSWRKSLNNVVEIGLQEDEFQSLEIGTVLQHVSIVRAIDQHKDGQDQLFETREGT